jgi:hypothetical protein
VLLLLRRPSKRIVSTFIVDKQIKTNNERGKQNTVVQNEKMENNHPIDVHAL